MNLEYKGMKSTRVKLVLLAFATATILLLISKLTGEQWVTLTLGSVVAYALSEVGAKAASAYKERA